MSNLSINDVNKFAINNNVYLNEEELFFTYNFVKNNWKDILNNHGNIDLSKYKEKYTPNNYLKIEKLIKEYTIKYSKFL